MALPDENQSPPAVNGGAHETYEMEAPMGSNAPRWNEAEMNARTKVLHSDIGINVLLQRLKQSIASARDFASFLRKRSTLEEEHATGMRKVIRATQEGAQRSEARQGTYSLQLNDLIRVHERIADNGTQFANSLHQMHDDLNEMANNIERGRKHWKQEGLTNEKNVKEAESQMEKAKLRYDSSAESYDKVKTGDSSGGRFGIKGPKSAEQREEDLLRKTKNADAEYAQKVQAAQVARQENLSTLRPQAIKALQDLIAECDSALTLQWQKFAAFNERLVVSNGIIISPLRGEDSAKGPASMRDMVQKIDNERDFQTFVTSHNSSVPPKPMEIKYEKHPVLGGTGAPPPPISNPTTSFRPPQSQSQPPTLNSAVPIMQSDSRNASISSPQPQSQSQPPTLNARPPTQPTSAPPVVANTGPTQGHQQGWNQPSGAETSFRGPPQHQQQQQPYPQQRPTPVLQTSPQMTSPQARANDTSPAYNKSPMSAGLPSGGAHTPQGPFPRNDSTGPVEQKNLPPQNPVFGVPLEELYQRDDTAVPLVIYQCLQAVDLFGLETEGIYRISGNSAHINRLKEAFDHDSTRVDFRNPENFYHDVNSVAGLLKLFFRDLPDPLFTDEHYNEFIDAAKIDDDVQRRDSLHAIINSLPDPNYATLRALCLHLYRIQEHAASNRMTTHNIAICFAPTLMMAKNAGSQVADAAFQARVLDTVLENTYQIFDED